MNPSNSGKWSKVGVARGERRKRTIYTKEQVARLTEAFQAHPYPGYEARERLARQIGIPEARIHVWFQNRRARQPKPVNPTEHERPEGPSVPRPATGSLDYSGLSAGPVWGDPRPLGRTWSFPGQPPAFPQPGGSQEFAPSTSSPQIPVGSAPFPAPPNSANWDASAPSGSGLVPTVPQPSRQHHLLQTPLAPYSHHPYPQQQTPQLGGHLYSTPPCSSPDSALGLHGAMDPQGPLGPIPAPAADGQVAQAGFYGIEDESWGDWRRKRRVEDTSYTEVQTASLRLSKQTPYPGKRPTRARHAILASLRPKYTTTRKRGVEEAHQLHRGSNSLTETFQEDPLPRNGRARKLKPVSEKERTNNWQLAMDRDEVPDMLVAAAPRTNLQAGLLVTGALVWFQNRRARKPKLIRHGENGRQEKVSSLIYLYKCFIDFLVLRASGESLDTSASIPTSEKKPKKQILPHHKTASLLDPLAPVHKLCGLGLQIPLWIWIGSHLSSTDPTLPSPVTHIIINRLLKTHNCSATTCSCSVPAEDLHRALDFWP